MKDRSATMKHHWSEVTRAKIMAAKEHKAFPDDVETRMERSDYRAQNEEAIESGNPRLLLDEQQRVLSLLCHDDPERFNRSIRKFGSVEVSHDVADTWQPGSPHQPPDAALSPK